MQKQRTQSLLSKKTHDHLFRKLPALLLLLLFCSSLLFGCSPTIRSSGIVRTMPEPAPTFSADATRQKYPQASTYSEMSYQGIHPKEDAEKIVELHKSIEQTDDLQQIQLYIMDYQTLYNNYLTQSALASIEYRKDTSNDYWRTEHQTLTTAAPLIKQASDGLLRDLYHSPHYNALLKWQPQLFKWLDTAPIYTDATQPLLMQEATLVEAYNHYLSEASVVYRGHKYTYNSMQMLSGNAYTHVLENWLDIHYEPLSWLYIEIVQVRDELAKELGYQTYTQLHFDAYDGGYTASMATALIENIKQEMVPVFTRAVRSGLYEQPTIKLSYDDMLDFSRNVLADLSPDFLEALDYMLAFELCDAEANAYKESGASTTYINDFNAPYMLLSYTDDQHSMQTFLHEFAHFQDDFSTAWSNPSQMDIAEIFPQTLILFVSDYYPAYMGQDKGLRMQHDTLSNCFLSMLIQPYYTAIELQAYAQVDQLTPDYLQEIARREYEAFGRSYIYGTADWQHLDWVANPQVASRPFHTLTYATSADTALQIWELAQTDQQAAMQVYFSLLHAEDASYMERLQAEGLRSPFSKEQAVHNAQLLQTYIVDKDFRGIQTAA